MKWPLVPIGECTNIVSGSTPKTSVASYWDGDIHWATPKDLSELDGPYLEGTPRKLTPEGLRNCGAEILPSGSVLFSSRAPIGLVGINKVPMATNQGFKSFVPSAGKMEARYLYHWLRANRTSLQAMGNGATFKELSKAAVSRIKIPLPPIGEQRRIADILDKAEVMRAKRREAIARLETLAQSIFIEMFGDVAKNLKGWSTRPLGSQLGTIRYGTGSPPPYVDEGLPFIRATNIKNGTVEVGDLRYISPVSGAGIPKCRVNSGDLIVVRSGVNTGDCAVVPRDLDGAYAAYDLIIECDPSSAIFYNHILNSPSGRD